MRRRGRLISLEGITGAGKSTALKRLRRRHPRAFVDAGGYVRPARVPTAFHRDLLTAIRRQLARDEFLRLDWTVECLVVQAELLLADATIIGPNVLAGGAVVYEHHQSSVLAYQAARLVEARTVDGIGPAVRLVARALDKFRVRNEPDITVFFDVPPGLAAARAAVRDGRKLTPASRKFNHLVAEGYRLVLADRRTIVRVSNLDEAVEALSAAILPLANR